VWLNAKENPAYRKTTLYLYVAEDVETLGMQADLLTAPPGFAPARPADVPARMAAWLGVQVQDESGRRVLSLVS